MGETRTSGRSCRARGAPARVVDLEDRRAGDVHARLNALLEATPDLVATVDAKGRLLSLNRSGRAMLGLGPTQDLGRVTLASCCADWARSTIRRTALASAQRDGSWRGEAALVGTGGREIPVGLSIVARRGRGGIVEFLLVVARDLGDRRRLEAEMVYLVDHDRLTGLFNRSRFEEDLSLRLDARGHGALLLLNIDEFRWVNASRGRHGGDSLLAAAAQALREDLPAGATLARLDGDEFAVYIPGADQRDAEALASNLRRGIREHASASRGGHNGITASVGIALFPAHGRIPEILLAHADLAMRESKDGGGDRSSVFRLAMEKEGPLQSRAAWERRIGEALKGERFELHAQPILDLRSGRVKRYELLLRMRDAGGELTRPAAFLPVAERSGLVHAIDRWVLRKAVEMIAEQQDAGCDLRLEINLSGKAFADPELLPAVRRELASNGIEPERLLFEITETAIVADMVQARRFIESLKDLGCRFALDDFGAGFSSFSYLKHLPVDALKLDGDYVRNLPESPTDQHLVRAMVDLAHGLGMETVAEFVERPETVALLRSYGVDFAQGDHIGPPRPLAEALAAESAAVR